VNLKGRKVNRETGYADRMALTFPRYAKYAVMQSLSLAKTETRLLHSLIALSRLVRADARI
jgi:hypothetical protein